MINFFYVFRDSVCIVGSGILSSQTQNTSDFIKKLRKGKSLAEDLRKKARKNLPFDFSLFYDEKLKKEDYFSITPFAVCYDREISEGLRKKHKLKKEDYTNSEVFFIDVIDQTFKPFCKKQLCDKSKIDLVVATSSESAELTEWFYKKHYEDLKSNFPEKKDVLSKIFETEFPFLKSLFAEKNSSFMNRALMEKAKKHFEFKGESLLFDSACASSLSSLYISVERLKKKKADCIFFVALAESQNLSPPAGAVLFSKLGALSEKKSLPFDYKTDGLCFGEAFIGFSLMRLADAQKQGLKVLGVIHNISGSSDGSFSGITEPSFEGQVLAYKRTYENTSGQQGEKAISAEDIDYIETHGTGTVVGDRTELKSLTEFFDNRKIPIGSVKSVLGHTMPASGAAGLLKCLCMLQEREIFPSSYFESFPEEVETRLFLNRKSLDLKKKKPLHLALSSFGFGGCNYHLILKEYTDDLSETKKTTSFRKPESEKKENLLSRLFLERKQKRQEDKIVLCSQSELNLMEIRASLLQTKLKIPPKVLRHLDDMQLGALMAVEKMMENSLSHLDRENVSVISSGHISLERAYNFLHKICLLSQKRLFSNLSQNFLTKKDIQDVLKYFEKKLKVYKELTEDTCHGMLTNVVAGRVCNMFHFQGISFHVDNNFASQISALECADLHLKKFGGGVFLLSFFEKENPSWQIRRKAISCMFLATKKFALENNLPILYEISEFSFEREEEKIEEIRHKRKKEKRYAV